jgi:cytoplasmic iron level regulating protein YaaA (DUF328/UPF0246 family)
MIKILLAPSESKIEGFTNPPINKNSFIFPELYDKRLEVLEKYMTFVGNRKILEENTLLAINRYSGVAFDFIDYASLNIQSQDYINNNVLIFSNLFGVIKANDLIPNYTFKQGTKIPNFNLEKFYKDEFSTQIDDYLKDDIIIDLRAKFYEKFYKIKTDYITFKFIKNGKVVSHYAKKYRGLLLGYFATNNITSIEQIFDIKIDNLKQLEVLEEKNKKEIIFEVLE